MKAGRAREQAQMMATSTSILLQRTTPLILADHGCICLAEGGHVRPEPQGEHVPCDVRIANRLYCHD